MRLILFAGLLCAGALAAAEKLDNSSNYQIYYTDAAGTKVEMIDAVRMSVAGKTVFRCQTVQASLSKAGTSIGLKNIKKPKIEEK